MDQLNPSATSFIRIAGYPNQSSKIGWNFCWARQVGRTLTQNVQWHPLPWVSKLKKEKLDIPAVSPLLEEAIVIKKPLTVGNWGGCERRPKSLK